MLEIEVQHLIITINQRTNLKKSWSSQMMEQSGLATRSCSGELHDIVPGDERRSRTIKYFSDSHIFMKVTSVLTPSFHRFSILLDDENVD